MSVVVCRILEGGGYEIASDSISVRGITQSKGENSKFSKLFEENDIVVGGVGTAREIALMQLYCRTHKPSDASESAMLEFISEFVGWKKDKTNEAGIENSYMIGFGGKVFDVEGWFIHEITTYEAIGAGMNYALTALYLVKSAREAVEVAIHLSIYCEGPVVLISKPAADSSRKSRSK
jgi:ATP-dependent protease HslVU (ClpYQ) peptidase subunit